MDFVIRYVAWKVGTFRCIGFVLSIFLERLNDSYDKRFC
jgi:hypothetical protein